MLADLQQQFADAILANSAEPLGDRLKSARVPAATQVLIYRNNVFSALTRALSDLYPVVEKLVGEEFFAAMAREYIPANMPTNAMISDYGADFPEFLDTFAALAELPYLADVARLEIYWNEAFHAADANSLPAEKLADLSGEQLSQLILTLHPSIRMIVSKWPIATIWQAHQDEAGPDRPIDLSGGGEGVLIVRPGLQVEVSTLSPGGFALIIALMGNKTVDEAVDAAQAMEPDFDIVQTLEQLLTRGIVIDARPQEE